MKIDQIYVYPIKSLRGVSLPSAELTPYGLSHDRRFMLLKVHEDASRDSDDGKRYENMAVASFPQMCLFTTELVNANDPSDASIKVTFTSPSGPSPKTTIIPLQPTAADLTPLNITMHSSPTTALVMPTQHNDWFSACFNFPVLLAWLGPSSYRTVLGNIAPNAATRNPIRRRAQLSTPIPTPTTSWLSSFANKMPGLPTIFSTPTEQAEEDDYSITFADCAPYLVASTTSLSNVSSRLAPGTEMDMTKFRPNIVISGAASPFEEDFWDRLTISPTPSSTTPPTTLHLTANCVRCASITVDYTTGAFSTGPPGQVLKKLQSDRRVDTGHKYSPVFGRYAFLDREAEAEAGRGSSGGAVVSVGDLVEVAKEAKERTVFKWPGIGQTPKGELFPL